MSYGYSTHSIALQVGHLLLQGSAESRHQPPLTLPLCMIRFTHKELDFQQMLPQC